MADTESTLSKPSLRVLEEVADAEDTAPAALENARKSISGFET
ncbi:hypothetical protein HALLA_00330 (plasmid) [Halostagnicola larsenii XH-48]|uniref:Uncharacterized protein n=1 Tax=Halostagnicola larsenii XH-48 TaxID=797299 RepID=W0JX27_9EURY|nr:hypothetical protein [Halostagnicola larsenii]AHG01770.1 hypothetical protein HALLA_00330 [Halostagnicola larsenii XH-48]